MITADSRQATIGRLITLLEQAANQGCQLVVFPELAGACQNSTWVVGVAKAGREDSVDLMGGSCIINPNGIIVACAQSLGDELVVADCDLDACLNGKAEEFNFARNRRPEHYAELTASKKP